MITKPNLAKILKPFENKWVALSPDYKKVLSSGKTLAETESKLNSKIAEKVVFHKVMPAGYAPHAL